MFVPVIGHSANTDCRMQSLICTPSRAFPESTSSRGRRFHRFIIHIYASIAEARTHNRVSKEKKASLALVNTYAAALLSIVQSINSYQSHIIKPGSKLAYLFGIVLIDRSIDRSINPPSDLHSPLSQQHLQASQTHHHHCSAHHTLLTSRPARHPSGREVLCLLGRKRSSRGSLWRR